MKLFACAVADTEGASFHKKAGIDRYAESQRGGALTRRCVIPWSIAR